MADVMCPGWCQRHLDGVATVTHLADFGDGRSVTVLCQTGDDEPFVFLPEFPDGASADELAEMMAGLVQLQIWLPPRSMRKIGIAMVAATEMAKARMSSEL